MCLPIFNIQNKKRNNSKIGLVDHFMKIHGFAWSLWMQVLDRRSSQSQVKEKSPRTKPSSQPILAPTLLTPVLSGSGIPARDLCSCLGAWTMESSAVAAPSPTQFDFFIVYLKKWGTSDENSFTDRARHATSFQDPSSSDLIAKAQFLSFIPDGLNTFLFFCDTIIC